MVQRKRFIKLENHLCTHYTIRNEYKTKNFFCLIDEIFWFIYCFTFIIPIKKAVYLRIACPIFAWLFSVEKTSTSWLLSRNKIEEIIWKRMRNWFQEIFFYVAADVLHYCLYEKLCFFWSVHHIVWLPFVSFFRKPTKKLRVENEQIFNNH